MWALVLSRIIEVIKSLKLWARNFLTYLLGLILSVLLSLWAFRGTLFGAFTNQLPLSGDGTLTAVFLRSLKESSFAQIFTKQLSINSLGWPNTLDFINYPVGNTLDLVWIKLLFLFNESIDESTLIHLVSMFKVILIYSSTFIVCKNLQFKNSLSLATGILFSLSSFNLIRSEGHFFLGLTWTIPIGVYLTLLSLRELRRDTYESVSKNHFLILGLAFVVGCSSFYYSVFFLIILGLIFLLFLFGNLMYFERNNFSNNYVVSKLTSFIKTCKVISISIAGMTLGLAVQIIPIYLGQREIVSTAKVSDRSFTESILYSGNLQSLFFDFSRIALHILHKEELLNFLQSQISWEGAQVGALTGTLLLLATILGLLNLTKAGHLRWSLRGLSANYLDLILIFIISLCLYFAGPLNYLISMFLPQIRAWGRISVLMSLLSIMLVSWFIQTHSKNSRIEAILIFALFMPGLAEVTSFREARPPSANLNQIAMEIQKQREESIEYLMSEIPASCPLAVLPLTPFPEFDNPADSTGDYSFFDLPLATSEKLFWINGSFKNTWENRFVEILYSQQPNFVRTDLEFQINYISAMGACGAVIDRTALTLSESDEFNGLIEQLAKTHPQCLNSVPGESFHEQSRFFLFKTRDSDCKGALVNEAKYFWSLTKNNNFVWRIDSPFAQKMNSSFQLFPSNVPIQFRLNERDEFRTDLQIGIIVRHYKSTGKIDSVPKEICISTLEKTEVCGLTQSVLGNQILLVPRSFVKAGITILSIRDNNPDPLKSWGIFLATLDKRGTQWTIKAS
jgi:hypothetical protein